MIIQIRVDDRLIHGQIAVVWSKHFATNHLVVANDQAAKNEVQQMSMMPLRCLIIQNQIVLKCLF